MQAAKKTALLPETERRKQIKKVEVKGDSAYLEAESERKGVLDVAGFEKTAGGLESGARATLKVKALSADRGGR